jgi:hypothetical protein
MMWNDLATVNTYVVVTTGQLVTQTQKTGLYFLVSVKDTMHCIYCSFLVIAPDILDVSGRQCLTIGHILYSFGLR